MTTSSALGPAVVSSNNAALQTAVSAYLGRYLGRYRGATRQHTESDLRIFLTWCTDQELDPLTAKLSALTEFPSCSGLSLT